MSTLGKIVIGLEAEYASFTRGTDKAAQSIDSVGKSAEGASGGVSGFFSSFAEGMGIGAGIELVSAVFEAAREAISKATEKMVEWVSESMKGQQESFRAAQTLHMHVDSLEGLQAAGRKAGLSNEELATALEKTNHAIGEAAVKGGEAAAGFTNLHLKARQLAGQGLDQSIRQIADELAKIQNPAEQAADAGAIFGEKLGPKLLPLLQQGSKGIEEIIRQAKESGVALNDIDAAKLTNAQRSLDELGERAEGAKNQLAIALAPTITDIGTRLLSLLPSADKMRAGFQSAFSGAVNMGAQVADVLSRIGAAFLRIEVFELRVYAGATRIQAAVVNTAVSIYKWAEGVPIVGSLIHGVENTIVGIAKSIYAVGKWIYDKVAAMVRAAASLASHIPGMGSANNQVSAVLDSAADAQDHIADILSHTADTMGNTDIAGKAKAWMADISKNAEEAGKATAKGLEGPIADVGPQVNEHAKQIEDVLKHLQEEAAGKGGQPKELFDLQNMGATVSQIESAKKLLDTISKQKIQIEVDKSLSDLAGQIATFGMNANQKKLFDLEKMGAGPEEIATAQTYLKELDKLEQHKKDVEEAKKLIDSTETPMQKYQAQVTELKRLSAEGLLSADQYAAALAKDNKELLGSEKGNADKKFAAETRRFNFKGPATGPQKADPMQQLTQIQKKQSEDVAKSTGYLAEIYRFGQNTDQNQDTVIDF